MVTLNKSSNDILEQVIAICLLFLIAVLPLIVNPGAIDFWYRPKAHSMYALLVLVGGCVLVRRIVYRRSLPSLELNLAVPLCCYALSAAISTIFSIAPRLSLCGDIWREESVATLLSYTALTYVFASLVRSEEQAVSLLRSLLVTSFLVSLYGCLQYGGFNPTEHFIPRYRGTYINSTMGNANFLGKFIVLTLPLSISACLIETSRKKKQMFAISIGIHIAALLLTFTRASWIACAGAIFMYVLLLRRVSIGIHLRTIIVWGIGLGCIVAVVLSCLSSTAPHERRFFSTLQAKIAGSFDVERGMGSGTRLFVWRKSIALICNRPLFGYGPDAHVVAMHAFNAEYIRRFNNPVLLDRAHNNYLDTAIAQGLVGLGAYCWILAVCLFRLHGAIRDTRRTDRKIMYIGLFSAFFGYLINDIFIFSIVTVSPTFWALMGLAYSLRRFETGCTSVAPSPTMS
ncbi:MAG: O-antigen ligase family protein [Desulfobacterota bacterium]|nr:O-antigen ligase family protein [Thermodesulfobacteriota bacterium]